MGGFGSLIQTASGALEKKRQRQIEEQERAGERELDTMRRALMQAQITKLQRPETPTARNIDPNSPEGIAARVDLEKRIRALGPKPSEGGPPEAKQYQGVIGDFARRTLDAHALLTDLETRYPGIGQRVDTKARPILIGESFGIVGRAGAKAIAPLVAGAMTPEEQQYFNAAQDLGNARLRKATGAQINDQEWEREIRPYIPLSGEGAGNVLTQKQARRLNSGLSDAQQAGPGFTPDLLTPEGRRYWDAYQTERNRGGRPKPRQEERRPNEDRRSPEASGYNPKFWSP